jgi:peptide/nickel transport system permease protein
MARYIVKRLVQMALTLWIFLTLIFFILYLPPGDYTDIYLDNPQITPEAREQIREQLGLDQPRWPLYLRYLSNFFQGNLGDSFKEYPRHVWDIIVERMPRTVLLFVTASVLSFYLGFVLGKWIGWRRGALLEYLATVTGVFFWTVFTPWFALFLIWIFAFHLGWFPLGHFIDYQIWTAVDAVAGIRCEGLGATACTNYVFNQLIGTAFAWVLSWGVAFWISLKFAARPARRVVLSLALALIVVGTVTYWTLAVGSVQAGGRSLTMIHLAWDILYHMILPVLTLTLISFAGTMLLMRSTMLESLREDYIMVARAKGLPDQIVRDRHAARNALLPVTTYFVIGLALSIDGSIFIEKAFSWPGMGLTLLNSAIDRDYPMAIGALVFTGVFALIAHWVADVLYAYLDPRIKYG